jgi:protein-tyrosine phosphatase
LPGIDDGAHDLSDSLEFAKSAVKQGVEVVFATPHAFNGVYDNSKQFILDACLKLSEFFNEKGILLKIVPGSEIRVNHDLIKKHDEGALLTLNNGGSHLLIELPEMFMTNAISMMIRQLCDRGVIPIVAHAERNGMIYNNPDLAAEFIYHGALIQITAGSLIGEFGKYAMKTAQALVKGGHVFCMGSDIHPGRKYCMAKAQKKLIKLLGQTEAELITTKNPFTVLNSQGVENKNILIKEAY